LVAIE